MRRGDSAGTIYRSGKGNVISVEQLGGAVGDTIELDRFLIKDDNGLQVRQPHGGRDERSSQTIAAQRRGKDRFIFKYKR